MGENDGEIFKRLREIGEGVARIDERTARIDGDMREHHSDHEGRIRALERDSDRSKGALAALERDSDKRRSALAVVGSLSGAIGGAIMWLIKFLFGGAQ